MAGWFGQLCGEQDGGWSRDPVRVTAELGRSIAAGSQEPGLDVFASSNMNNSDKINRIKEILFVDSIYKNL